MGCVHKKKKLMSLRKSLHFSKGCSSLTLKEFSSWEFDLVMKM